MDQLETSIKDLVCILSLANCYEKQPGKPLSEVFGPFAEKRIQSLRDLAEKLTGSALPTECQVRDAFRKFPAARVQLLQVFDIYQFCMDLGRGVVSVRASRDRAILTDFKTEIERIEADFERQELKGRCEDETLAHRFATLFFLSEELAQKIASVLQIPFPFQLLFSRELDCIERSRELRKGIELKCEGAGCWERARGGQLFGLALSGGGIRSATFNLGVLQGLAETRILGRLGTTPILKLVDYLSTVSGGGYIGSWLHAWIMRSDESGVKECSQDNCLKRGIDQVISNLSPADCPNPDAEPQKPIKFLRRYSRYLTPNSSFLSADTWTVAAIWVRNTLLNLTILVLGVAAVLLVPKAFYYPLSFFARQWWSALIAAALVMFAGIFLGMNLASFSEPERRQDRFIYQQKGVQFLIVLPLFFAALLFASSFVFLTGDGPAQLYAYTGFGALIGVVLLAIGITGRYWECWFENSSGQGTRVLPWLGLIAACIVSGAVASGLAWVTGLAPVWKCQLWVLLPVGPPLLLLFLSLIAVSHIGILGKNLPDDRREWWGRLGAYVLLYAVAWLFIAGVSIWSYDWILDLGLGWRLKSALSLSWIASTVAGVAAGNSTKTGISRATKSAQSHRALEIVAKIAPYVFVAGLVVLLSYVMRAISLRLPVLGVPDPFRAVCGIATGFLLAFVLAWRININEFSMHHFYRNRLIRCYLGASHGRRRPNRFTGFDPEDDRYLSDFTPKSDAPLPGICPPTEARPRYSGPYPIINAALNIVQGDELAWQDRKAQSFMFTPEFCGYATTPTRDVNTACAENEAIAEYGFRPTQLYAYSGRGIHLGSAMAISGAAQSPNQGFNTSPASAFLMTVFNVRLGWWLSNTRDERTWRRSSPRLGLFYLAKELLADTNNRSRYVYLSDGGHFENLGLYELVHRRCKFIIVCDASHDGSLKFEDLGNAIRRCRTDFGAEIEIGLNPLRLNPETRLSSAHCVAGRVYYDDGSRGTLLYIKPTFTGDEPADLAEYRSEHPEFPHESTFDQFFSESQFESYRKLGYHIIANALAVRELKAFEFEGRTMKASQPETAREAVGAATPGSSEAGVKSVPKSNPNLDALEETFDRLSRRWYPSSPFAEKSFTKLAAQFDELNSQLRKDPRLRGLDQEFYPEVEALGGGLTPKDPSSFRSKFYYCVSLMQLMEDVYMDLKLEENFDHPDNRGWINLFSRWILSPTFRFAWNVNAGMFGTRFRYFVKGRFGLSYERISIFGPVAPEALRPHIRAALAKRKLPEQNSEIFAIELPGLESENGSEGAKSGSASIQIGFVVTRVSAGRDRDGLQSATVVYLWIDERFRGLGMATKVAQQLRQRGFGFEELSDGFREDAAEPPDVYTQVALNALNRRLKDFVKKPVL